MGIRAVSTVTIVGLLVLGLLFTASAGIAGPPEPPSPPGSTYSYTLADIYERLDEGAENAQSTFTEPSSGPGLGTGYTLNDVMAKAPAPDNTDGAVPVQVLAGTTYWSLRTDGTWGPQAGTAASGTDLSGPDGAKTFSIPDGFYTGRTATANDGDLAPENIKLGVDLFGVTGTLYSAGVPKTGQTTSYRAGDDGDLEHGVAWPSPRFTVHDSGTPGSLYDDTVTDNLTGLMWARSAWIAAEPIPWTEAIDAANTLDLGGYDDWRLPNVRELYSLADFSQTGPALPPGHPFLSVGSIPYWTSTTTGNDSGYAFIVLLYATPYVSADNKNNFSATMWPVRGGP